MQTRTRTFVALLAALAAAAPAHAETAKRAPAHEPDVVFVPTPPDVVAKMLDLAAIKPTDVVYDLGCGDGRLVVGAAQRGARRAVGVDIDPQRIEEARANVKKAGVQDRATIVEGDLFQTDLHEATVVTLYLLPDLNLRLRPKLLALPAGTRIVSHAFDMGEWKPDRVEHVDGRTVYFWTVPARSAAAQGTGAR